MSRSYRRIRRRRRLAARPSQIRVPRCPRGSRTRAAAVVTVAGAALLLVACSSNSRLMQYDFRGGTLGVVTIAPPHPEVLTGMDVDVDADNPIESLIRTGAAIVREASAEGVRARLDSAAARIDVSERMGDRVLGSVARYLRAKPIENGVERGRPVDYELELRVRRYGIAANSWSSGAYFLIDADVMLMDGETGRRIWETGVHATKPIRNSDIGIGDRSITDIVTAASLSEMSVEQIERALETLAAFAADYIVAEFSEALDEARG